MRWLFCVAVLLAATGPLQAAGYDDLSLAITANVRDDPETAVVYFTSALKSSDLVPAHVAAVYHGRAAAYYDLKQYKESLADLESYAALRPLDRRVLLLRARVKMCLGDSAGGQKDWEAVAGVKPAPADYWAFGRMLWGAGRFDEAHSNMLLALDGLNLKYTSYAESIVLWYAMTAERAGKPDPDKVAKLIKALDERGWPMSLLNFYLGKATQDDVRYQAESWRSDRAMRRSCEADFFLGEWFVAHRDIQTATPMLLAALDHCTKYSIEHRAAEEELARVSIPAKGPEK